MTFKRAGQYYRVKLHFTKLRGFGKSLEYDGVLDRRFGQARVYYLSKEEIEEGRRNAKLIKKGKFKPDLQWVMADKVPNPTVAYSYERFAEIWGYQDFRGNKVGTKTIAMAQSKKKKKVKKKIVTIKTWPKTKIYKVRGKGHRYNLDVAFPVKGPAIKAAARLRKGYNARVVPSRVGMLYKGVICHFAIYKRKKTIRKRKVTKKRRKR